MFHWPIISAIIGISTNLFFIALVCILSYLRFAPEDNGTIELFTYKKDSKDDSTNDKCNFIVTNNIVCLFCSSNDNVNY